MTKRTIEDIARLDIEDSTSSAPMADDDIMKACDVEVSAVADQMFADPMDELFESRREACDAGKYRGSSEAISWARQELSKLSGKHEPADDPAKFHAVEECCAVLRKIAEMIEVERERSKIGQH